MLLIYLILSYIWILHINSVCFWKCEYHKIILRKWRDLYWPLYPFSLYLTQGHQTKPPQAFHVIHWANRKLFVCGWNISLVFSLLGFPAHVKENAKTIYSCHRAAKVDILPAPSVEKKGWQWQPWEGPRLAGAPVPGGALCETSGNWRSISGMSRQIASPGRKEKSDW